jgi:uncharacterized protein
MGSLFGPLLASGLCESVRVGIILSGEWIKMDYEQIVQDALRLAVRRVLKETQQTGLKPPHHFYISFATTYPGVDVPDFLKESSPEEVTIVLQHQFWDLQIEEKYFKVILNFQEVPYNVSVPFDALLSFMDPGVKFGLQFTPPPVVEALDVLPAGETPPEKVEKNNVIAVDFFRRK